METNFFKLQYTLSLFIFLVGVNLFAQQQSVSDSILSIREYNKAVLFYQNNKYDSALIHLNNGIKLNPSYAYCYALKAEIFYLNDQFKEALLLSNEAIRLDPGQLNWYIVKGGSEKYLNLYDESIISLTKALKINQNNAGVYSDRAVCYKELKEYAKALEDIKKAISIKNNVGYYILKAEIDYYLLNHRTCIADINTFLKLGGKGYDKNICLFRGVSYYYMDNIDSAIVDLYQLIKLGSQDIRIFNMLGRCYSYKKDSMSVIKYFTESLKIEPKNSLTYLDYARAEYKMGNCALAKMYCEKSLEYVDSKKTNLLNRYNFRGLVNVCLGNTQSALSDYATAIKINPKEMAPHFNRMKLIFDDTTKTAYTIKECDDMIRSNIDSSELCYIYNLRGYVKLRSNNKQGALQDLKIAKDLSKSKAFVYYNIAIVYIYFMDSSANQLDEEVFNNLTKCLLIDNKNIDAYKLLAVWYIYKDDLSMACETIKKGIKIKSDTDLLYIKDIVCSKKIPKNQHKIFIEPFNFTDGNSLWMKDFVDGYKKRKKILLPLL
jgi:tetratricopeptide (TPR) repeat protein